MKPRMLRYDARRDFGEVYRLFTEPSVNCLIIDTPAHGDMISFEKWLNDGLSRQINDFFVFWSGREFVGFAYSYDFKAMDGHAAITVAVKPNYQTTGVGVLVAFQFIRYLFDHYPLRKIYMRMYAFNQRGATTMRDFGLEEECVLREYHYYKGEYHDLSVYSLYRDKFSKRYSEIFLQEVVNNEEN